MLTIFKKTEKSKENLRGIKQIDNIKELNKPLLLCFSPQDAHDNSIYGVVKIGAQAARVNTTEEVAAGFKIDEFPIDFVGIKYENEERILKELRILNKIVMPYLFNNDDKSVEHLEKRARNINVLTYCDGTSVYVKMEDLLVRKLTELGYKDEDIKRVVSKISLTAIDTMVDTSNVLATTVKILDVNDDEIMDDELYEMKEKIDNNRFSSICIKETNSNVCYYYKGSGEHDLKEYLDDSVIAKPFLCSVVSYFLEKSVKNNNSQNVQEISCEDILRLYDTYGNDTFAPKKLVELLDKKLSYEGAPKYTKSEAKFRKELDESYGLLYVAARDLRYKTKSNNENEQKVRKLVETIKKYSSETTFNQIMSELRMWNVVGDYSRYPSDKEIRSRYEAVQSNRKKV